MALWLLVWYRKARNALGEGRNAVHREGNGALPFVSQHDGIDHGDKIEFTPIARRRHQLHVLSLLFIFFYIF